MRSEKQPLYRRENKRAWRHRSNDPGSEFRYERNTKAMSEFEGTHKSIKSTRGGQDYTPLYKFLLSKVGQPWDEVHSEAISRLDSEEPIYYMVQTDPLNMREVVRLGESTQYSALKVENGILVKVNPDAKPWPRTCTCCTHTFNGKVMTEKSEHLMQQEAIVRDGTVRYYNAGSNASQEELDEILRLKKKSQENQINFTS